MDASRKTELLDYLVSFLQAERQEHGEGRLAVHGEEFGPSWDLFRALVNTRQPFPAPQEFLDAQDELLSDMIAEAGITSLADIPPAGQDPRIHLWRGDITTLAVDAIVNAANAQMLGCWVPGHYCIDNAIHTFAGVQLRIECNRIMQAQGHEEPTGKAKMTPAYNLPSTYVLHTVGPIAQGNPTAEHEIQLASCYLSCLEVAQEKGLGSLAFCCISTGVFGFPQREAAAIAVKAVREFLHWHEDSPHVVFNVFGETDEVIYRDLLC